MDFDAMLPDWALLPVLLAAIAGFFAWAMLRKAAQARASVVAAARALSLPELTAPHRRMKVFGGPVMNLRVECASEAHFGAIYEPVVFTHAYGSSILLRVYLPRPLAVAFRIDSSRGAEANVDSRDARLEAIFKVWTQSPDAFRCLFDSQPLRQAVNSLFGATPSGSGRIVRVDERGVYVFYSEPEPELAAELAHAMVRVANLLVQREAFRSSL